MYSCIFLFYAGSCGYFSYKFTWDERGVKRYTFVVEAEDPDTKESVTLRGQFRVLGDQQKYFCTGNMINTGTQPIPKGGSVEYVSVGENITSFKCKMIHLPSFKTAKKTYTCEFRLEVQ